MIADQQQKAYSQISAAGNLHSIETCTQNSEVSINGTPFVQILVSHLRKNPTYKLQFWWYHEFRFHQDRPIYMKAPLIHRPTCPVLTVVALNRQIDLRPTYAGYQHCCYPWNKLRLTWETIWRVSARLLVGCVKSQLGGPQGHGLWDRSLDRSNGSWGSEVRSILLTCARKLDAQNLKLILRIAPKMWRRLAEISTGNCSKLYPSKYLWPKVVRFGTSKPAQIDLSIFSLRYYEEVYALIYKGLVSFTPFQEKLLWSIYWYLWISADNSDRLLYRATFMSSKLTIIYTSVLVASRGSIKRCMHKIYPCRVSFKQCLQRVEQLYHHPKVKSTAWDSEDVEGSTMFFM